MARTDLYEGTTDARQAVDKLATSGTHIAEDGTVRKDYYGSGKQPWNTMRECGWAPYYAAGAVVKYLRRDKEPKHSLDSARWYYDELRNIAASDNEEPTEEEIEAFFVLERLIEVLTPDELAKLNVK